MTSNGIVKSLNIFKNYLMRMILKNIPLYNCTTMRYYIEVVSNTTYKRSKINKEGLFWKT